MSLRLVFDENIGRPLVMALAGLLRFAADPPEIKHLLEITEMYGAKDNEWIPKLASGGWIVVSADHGRKGGAKLPLLCRQHRITHVLLSPALCNEKQLVKALALLSVWPRLLELPAKPAGSRFVLVKGSHHAVLTEKAPPATPARD